MMCECELINAKGPSVEAGNDPTHHTLSNPCVDHMETLEYEPGPDSHLVNFNPITIEERGTNSTFWGMYTL